MHRHSIPVPKHSTKSNIGGNGCVFEREESHGAPTPVMKTHRSWSEPAFLSWIKCNTRLTHGQKWGFVSGYSPGIVVSCSTNYTLLVRLTFTDGTDASPGAVVPAYTCGRTDKMVALGTSEMDLVSYKILWAKLGSMSRSFQRRAGGGSCGRETESMRGRLVTCGVSLLTSSGILCLGKYTCHRVEQGLHGKRRLKCLI